MQDEDIDEADAWGWGDEGDEDTAEPQPEPEAKPAITNVAKSSAESHLPRSKPAHNREITLTESYTISSMPGPVFQTVTSILKDASRLKSNGYVVFTIYLFPNAYRRNFRNENNPVAPAAVGLFNLPVLILAMYRAVSPYYYNRDQCGNM